MNRGGSWNNNAENCRVANRNNNNPDNRNNNLGFRLVSTKRHGHVVSFKDEMMTQIVQVAILHPIRGIK